MLCKALSDENRLRIAYLLTGSDACVCELADALDLPQSTLSNHLAKMRDSDLLQTRKDGTWIYYQLSHARRPQIEAIFSSFERELSADDSLKQDRERFGRRLRMRIDGRCHQSYGQLKNNYKMKELTLKSEDIHCDSCASSVSKALSKVEGVFSVRVDVPSQSVHVEYDSPADEVSILVAMDDAGFEVVPRS